MSAVTTKLRAHQERGAALALSRPGTMLAFEVGCGKTLAALATLDRAGADRVLVTCPLSVVGVWEREARKHAPGRWRVVRCDRGGVAQRAAAARAALAVREPVLVAINHESVWREPFAALVRATEWGALVADESHRAKDARTKLSTFLASLRTRVPLRLALTGTPMPHSPLDVFGQAQFLDASAYGSSYVMFRRRYAVLRDLVLRDGRRVQTVVGYQNLDDLERRLATFAMRVRKCDVLDLPPEVDEDRTCRLEPAARRLYDQLADNLFAEIESGEVTAGNALVRLLRLQQVTSGTVTADDGSPIAVSTAKRDALLDTLTDLAEPVVVFCRFVADLDAVREVAERLGRRYGELSGRDKGGLSADAEMSPDVDVLGVQIQAGGLGVDLTRAAVAVYYSMGFSLGELLQARGRLHRPGQTRTVVHVRLLAEDTVDEDIAAALDARQDLVEAVLSLRHARPTT